ncbi:MAG: signal recognition particle receptor subunit alpha, partial [Burkholderiaceae bacterium]|nr:signal recognition particle receptor subunit alpha [Burkholderiaceae bacterium]
MFSFFKKKAPAGASAAPTPDTPAPAADVESGAGNALIGSALVAPIDLAQAPTEPAPRQSWMAKLKAGLRKTGGGISSVFNRSQIDESLYEDLESALLMADTGVKATTQLIKDVRRRATQGGATHAVQVKNLLVDALTELLRPLEKSLVIGAHHPTVIMVAGVNGAGKTTSIGKLTRHLADAGASVLLAAADTFRAAAREQLGVWADRNTVDI